VVGIPNCPTSALSAPLTEHSLTQHRLLHPPVHPCRGMPTTRSPAQSSGGSNVGGMAVVVESPAGDPRPENPTGEFAPPAGEPAGESAGEMRRQR
jgi:hypothetical protein